MPIQKVTREKMLSKDYYRQQVNANKDVIAFGYNALAGFLPREAVEIIRNRLASAVEQEIKVHLAIHIEGNPQFATFLARYLKEYVEDSLKRDAMELWRECGWKG